MNGPDIAHPPDGRQLFGDVVAPLPTVGEPRSAPAEHEAIAFLRWLDLAGRHNLVGLDPRGGPAEGRTFEPGSWDAMQAWVEARDGRLNLYYAVNEPRAGSPHKKLADRDIGAKRCIVADLDPRDGEPLDVERSRLRQVADAQRSHGSPAVIDSGGGFHIVWRLHEKLDIESNGKAVRDQCRGVAKALGGDDVHDASRILRLPGTLNIPDAKKKARGRKTARARLVAAGGYCRLADLASVYPPIAYIENATDNDAEIGRVAASLDMNAICGTSGLHELDPVSRARFERELTINPTLTRLWNGDVTVLGPDKTGSAFRGKLAIELNRAGGFTAQDFGELLFCWPHAVASDQDVEDVVTARSIARDWVRLGRPHSPDVIFGPVPDQAASTSATQKRIETHSFMAMAERAGTQSKYLIKGLLDCGASSVLFAPPGAGKTFVILDIAFHVAMGLEWNGMRVRQGGVVYIVAEGQAGAAKRAAAIRNRYGLAQDVHVPMHYVVSRIDLLRSEADISALVATICDLTEIRLVIVDTLAQAMAGGDENSSNDMGAYIANVNAIRARTGAHVLSVHHTGKDVARGARGWSGLKAAIDSEIEIIERTLVADKQRETESGLRLAFDLEKVRVGTDEDGDAITSCVIRWLGQDANSSQLTYTEKMVLCALDGLTRAGNENGVNARAVAEAVERTGTKMNPDTARKHLGKLVRNGVADLISRGFWAVRSGNSESAPTKCGKMPIDFSDNPSGSKSEDDIFA